MSNAVRQPLFDRFDRLDVVYETVDHRPVMTVDDGRDLKATLPGAHTKNLFLKDKKGGLFFLSAHCDAQVDLVAFGKAVGARGRLSFGKPDLMCAIIGVEPGSVTPYALINAAPDAFVAVAFDARLLDHEAVWFHPLENTASTAISPQDLMRFARDCGVSPVLVDFSDGGVRVTGPAPVNSDAG